MKNEGYSIIRRFESNGKNFAVIRTEVAACVVEECELKQFDRVHNRRGNR